MTDRPTPGRRSREWTAVGVTELACLGQMARCVSEVGAVVLAGVVTAPIGMASWFATHDRAWGIVFGVGLAATLGTIAGVPIGSSIGLASDAQTRSLSPARSW